jgi:hypothetical protein
MVGVFERVYEVAPVFRAEPHDTTRHINEYVSLDVEFGFIENHFTVMGAAARRAGGTSSPPQANTTLPSWSWRARRCRSCRQRSRTFTSPMRRR